MYKALYPSFIITMKTVCLTHLFSGFNPYRNSFMRLSFKGFTTNNSSVMFKKLTKIVSDDSYPVGMCQLCVCIASHRV